MERCDASRRLPGRTAVAAVPRATATALGSVRSLTRKEAAAAAEPPAVIRGTRAAFVLQLRPRVWRLQPRHQNRPVAEKDVSALLSALQCSRPLCRLDSSGLARGPNHGPTPSDGILMFTCYHWKLSSSAESAQAYPAA